MDNSTMSAEVDELTREYSQILSSLYVQFGCIAAGVYHIIICFDEELKYVWSKRFNFATVFYICARYSSPIVFILTVMLTIWPPAIDDIVVCNALANTANAVQIPYLVGVRGLLSMRAYAIAQTKWLAIILLGGTFLADIILYICLMITFPGCLPSTSADSRWLSTAQIAAGIANDTFVFGFTMYELRGMRKKTKASLADNLSVILIKQGFLRYCFVITIGVTQEIINISTEAINTAIFGSIVTILSSLLVSDFFLRLRRHNTIATDSDTTSTNPNIRWSALQSRRQSSSRGLFQSTSDAIVTEMSLRDEFSDFRFETERLSSMRVGNASQDTEIAYNPPTRLENQYLPSVYDTDAPRMTDEYEMEEWKHSKWGAIAIADDPNH